jgi:thiopurine S-methyltransferase
MHADFWHERWSSNQIGFHDSAVNPLLVRHFSALGMEKRARVFLPLCGKTLDIDWLMSNGYRVAGAELSQLAVVSLFERLHLTPSVREAGALTHWSVPSLDIFVGDMFALTATALGMIDAVYDRAALIALPPDMRERYASHLDALTNGAPQLLITLAYEQSRLAGPPFSVEEPELRRLYPDRAPELLSRHELPGGFKGVSPATEITWLLPPA